MQLPINLPLPMMQTRWKSILDPVLSNLLINSILLQDITLITGNNTINHKLGRVPVGYIMVNSSTLITLYTSAPFTAVNMTVNASSGGVISLVVF